MKKFLISTQTFWAIGGMIIVVALAMSSHEREAVIIAGIIGLAILGLSHWAEPNGLTRVPNWSSRKKMPRKGDKH